MWSGCPRVRRGCFLHRIMRFDLLNFLDYGRSLEFSRSTIASTLFLTLAESPYESIDYTKTFLEVYTELAEAMVPYWGLEILTFVQHTTESLSDTNTPSWVPRWDIFCEYVNDSRSSETLTPEDTPADACLLSRSNIHLESGRLRVRGVVLGKISCAFWSI